MDFVTQIRYIFLEIDSNILFKLKYFFEKIFKFPILYINKYFNKNLPIPYLFSSDYILENKNGKFLIKKHSDFDYIINPYFEKELEDEFKINEGIFMDIGAHIGKWSIFVSKYCGSSKIYSFDANINTFNYLLENIKLNGLNNIIPVNIGISEKKDKLYFKSENNKTGISKIVDSNSGGSDIVEIKTNSIDAFIEENEIDIHQIRLLKIDVEGHELKVFQGMKQLLQESKDIKIICEILSNQTDKDEILNFMRSFGFDYKILSTNCDYVFTKK